MRLGASAAGSCNEAGTSQIGSKWMDPFTYVRHGLGAGGGIQLISLISNHGLKSNKSEAGAELPDLV